jgi:hypothetical protein
VIKNNNENFSSPLPINEPITVNHEQQTTTITVPTIDPILISTIHANKVAIDTIRGQITELRHDVDELRTQISNRKRSTISANPPAIIPNAVPPTNLPPISSSASNLNNTRRVSKPNANNPNPSSFSHHHHHHHHVEQPDTAGRSSVCIII